MQHLVHLNSDTQAHTSSPSSSSSSSSLSHHHHCCLTMSPLLSLPLLPTVSNKQQSTERLREKKEREQQAKRETLLLTPFSVDCCLHSCSLRQSFPFLAPSVVLEPTTHTRTSLLLVRTYCSSSRNSSSFVVRGLVLFLYGSTG